MSDSVPIGGEEVSEPRTWDSTVGPDGVGYLIEARPSGVIGWQYDQVFDLDYGLVVSIAGAFWNLFGRALFRFGWQVKVSRTRTRWPHRRKVVARLRVRRKADALAQLPDVVEAVHRHGRHALTATA
ncbi:hypothetical protein [Intrasporangium mesophilum]